MLPVVVIAGRPNVGKSTLFNVLTGTRDAIVADQPGVTRDRQYGRCGRGERQFLLVDTGGLSEAAEGVEALAQGQADLALREADLILLVLDARAGCSADDERVAERLRRVGKPVLAVLNKTDGIDWELESGEWYRLGFEQLVPIAAAHRRGIGTLEEQIERRLPPPDDNDRGGDGGVRVALVGRPNVGKSTLVNRVSGEARVLATETPGTTRDSISVAVERDGQRYILVDTAGVRRRARVGEAVEQLSVIKTLQSIDAADLAVVMLDARDGPVEQDARLLGRVLEMGCPMVLAINKWDGLSEHQRAAVFRELDRRFAFARFCPVVTISALHGSGLAELFDAIEQVRATAQAELSSHQLTEALRQAVARHQPPLRQGRTAKLRYAHLGGRQPLRIVVHGNRTETLPEAYRRYLLNTFRERFGLVGIPLRVEFKAGDNPYAGRRNRLTQRQLAKRKRLKEFTRKRGK